MGLLSSIQSHLHRLRGDHHSSHASTVHPQLQSWLDTQPSRSSKAAKALVADLQQALQGPGRQLDVSRHSPHIVSSLPDACLQAIRPTLDQLALPPGCDAGTVVRWANQLDLRELTAHDVHPRGAIRDRELPPQLTVLHGDEGLLHAADRLTTSRILDTRSPGAAPLTALPDRSSQASRQGPSAVTVQRWNAGARLAAQCLASHQPAKRQASMDAAPGLDAGEAAEMLELLHSVPTELLPVRGRTAARLACEWLSEGGRSELTLEQARQLDTALSQARLAFVLPSAQGPKLADASDQRWLHQLRDWENVGASAQDRRIREAGFERDLQLHHHKMTAYFKTPAAQADGHKPAASPTAASRPATPPPVAPTAAKPVPSTVQQLLQRPRRAWEEDAHGYMELRAIPAATATGTHGRSSSQDVSVYDTPPSRSDYDTLPPGRARPKLFTPPPVASDQARAPATNEPLYDVPPKRMGTSPLATRRMQAHAASPSSSAATHVPVGELAHARAQFNPFVAWLNSSTTGPKVRLNVSPAQFTALAPLVKRFASSAHVPAADRQAMTACQWVLERVAAGKVSTLSRADVSLLSTGFAALDRLPKDETAPSLPAGRPSRPVGE